MATDALNTGAHLRAPLTLNTILRFCEDNSMAPTRFGREAVGDPRLVIDMRNGREPTPRVAERVRAFIAGEAVPAPKPKPRQSRTVIYDMTDHRRHRQAMIRGSAMLLAAILRERGEA